MVEEQAQDSVGRQTQYRSTVMATQHLEVFPGTGVINVKALVSILRGPAN